MGQLLGKETKGVEAVSRRKHRGHLYSRTKHNPREKAFADCWERKNERVGSSLLQTLFLETPKPGQFGFDRFVRTVTPVDRFVAATVIQWLGSNVGMSFLDEALRECGYEIVDIEKEKPAEEKIAEIVKRKFTPEI